MTTTCTPNRESTRCTPPAESAELTSKDACPDGACSTGDAAQTSATETLPYVRPRVDLRETGDAAILLVDVPGVPADGVELTVENANLTITAKSALARPEGRVLLSEWAPVHYRRTFRLGDRSDVEAISATLEHGVLRVVIPKAQHARIRRIPVAHA